MEHAEDVDTENWAGFGLANAQASLARANEDWQAAVNAYNEAISYEDEAWVYCARAEVYMAMPNNDAARQDIESCLNLSSDDPDVHAWAEDLLQEVEE
jgi:hypothetical protein